MLRTFTIQIEVPDSITINTEDEYEINWKDKYIIEYVEDAIGSWSGQFHPDHPLDKNIKVNSSDIITLIKLLETKYDIFFVNYNNGRINIDVTDPDNSIKVTLFEDKFYIFLDDREYYSIKFKDYVSNRKIKSILKIIDNIFIHYDQHVTRLENGLSYSVDSSVKKD